jgi:hypothetical protein
MSLTDHRPPFSNTLTHTRCEGFKKTARVYTEFSKVQAKDDIYHPFEHMVLQHLSIVGVRVLIINLTFFTLTFL